MLNIVVYEKTLKRKGRKLLEAVKSRLNEEGVEYQIHLLLEAGTAREKTLQLTAAGERKIVAFGGDGTLCNYDLTTDKAWNYCIDESECMEKEVRLMPQETCAKNPWTLTGAPLRLTVPAHRLPSWKLLHKTEITQCRNLYEKLMFAQTGDFTFTPPLPEKISPKDVGEKETIALVPMGAAKLRVTVFPAFDTVSR